MVAGPSGVQARARAVAGHSGIQPCGNAVSVVAGPSGVRGRGRGMRVRHQRPGPYYLNQIVFFSLSFHFFQ